MNLDRLTVLYLVAIVLGGLHGGPMNLDRLTVLYIVAIVLAALFIAGALVFVVASMMGVL